jgi:hypothetical protein
MHVVMYIVVAIESSYFLGSKIYQLSPDPK